MDLPTLRKECSQFLKESNNLPLLKNLRIEDDGFRKVKVRKKNTNAIFIEAFNMSFSNHKNIFQRSIFANGEKSFTTSKDNHLEPFYIFPINGYQFVYNPIVSNALEQYKNDVTNLIEKVSIPVAVDMFSKVITQSYVGEDMARGINVGAEIIIYGIPYYYAVRKSLVDDYNKMV